jgi:hypothetical protein
MRRQESLAPRFTGVTRLGLGLLLALLVSAPRAGTPGEATQLMVTGYNAGTGDTSIAFVPACDAADHHIEYGLLQNVASLAYSGQECSVGSGGSFDAFDPGPESYFFIVVGNDGVATEGSYGVSLIGGMSAERAEDALDPSCTFVQDLSQRCDGPAPPVLEMTGFRPQSEAYGVPLQRTAVPHDQQVSPGVGIRINGDDDDGNGVADFDDPAVAGENDLIEVVLMVSPPVAPEGLEYVLARISGEPRVWEQSTKTAELLGAGDSVVLDFASGPRTVWVEKTTGGSAELALQARRIGDQAVVAADTMQFYSFTSVVIALGGEGQVPADPPLEPDNHGTFQVAITLYQRGYDVHMYDEDVVVGNGAGAAYDEVVSAVRDRGVSSIAIYGYSHGGGSTNDLAARLVDNAGTIGAFSIDFTAYVDGIDNDSDIDIGTETELPPSTRYHANYYENPGCGIFELCGGPISGADFDLNVNTTAWGATLGHFTIDDASNVLDGIRDQLETNVTP